VAELFEANVGAIYGSMHEDCPYGSLKDATCSPSIRPPDNSLRINIMSTLIGRFAQDESGATAIEYGLIAGLVAVVIITAVTTVGTKLTGTFNTIANKLP
jgi:pilus assembly protein Flp/PilA